VEHKRCRIYPTYQIFNVNTPVNAATYCGQVLVEVPLNPDAPAAKAVRTAWEESSLILPLWPGIILGKKRIYLGKSKINHRGFNQFNLLASAIKLPK